VTPPQWPGERTPEIRRATNLLMRVCGPSLPYRSVAYWDQRTSGNDARAALAIACGAPPNDLHPARGTWSRPTASVQLAIGDAA
jgi:hypothetical protein